MILEVYDNNNYYHFTLVKNKRLDKEYDTSGIVETHFGEKPLLIDKQKYIKLRQKEYNNPFEGMINDKVTSYTDENGNEVAYDYRQMILEKQRELKALNNPIEKEFMIEYK